MEKSRRLVRTQNKTAPVRARSDDAASDGSSMARGRRAGPRQLLTAFLAFLLGFLRRFFLGCLFLCGLLFCRLLGGRLLCGWLLGRRLGLGWGRRRRRSGRGFRY